MKERVVSKAFDLCPDGPDFYRASFGNCVFVLKGGGSLQMCDLDDCVFVPSYLDDDGNVRPEWNDIMIGCNVTAPRTWALIKPGEAAPRDGIDPEKRCRSHPGKVCYVRDNCVFGCTLDREG